MNVLRWAWNPHHYWPYGLLTVFGLFAIREGVALASGRSQDTLSYFAWTQLKIVASQSPSEWGAAAFLSFGMYVVVAVWLAYHIWFRRFT